MPSHSVDFAFLCEFLRFEGSLLSRPAPALPVNANRPLTRNPASILSDVGKKKRRQLPVRPPPSKRGVTKEIGLNSPQPAMGMARLTEEQVDDELGLSDPASPEMAKPGRPSFEALMAAVDAATAARDADADMTTQNVIVAVRVRPFNERCV